MRTENFRFITIFLFLCHPALAQESSVFISGNEGYKSFRIPAIIRLPGKQLLAFCEGRTNNAADFGNIDLVMKRSNDNGKIWSALQVIVDNENKQAGNPAPVIDLLNPEFPNGRIFLFYNTGNNHESEIAKGNGIRECFYITSSDGGYTWSAPANITTQVHRPNQPAADPAYHFTNDWRTYANTPGHALQITEGKYKGRIYVAANHSQGEPKKNAEHYFAHGFFSDDHGKTFSLSESVNLPGSNESTAAELSNGKLLLNARNQKGDVKARIVALSNDGGISWSSIRYDTNLPDPVCEGTLLNIGKKKGKPIIAFCNPADTAARNNLTLRISFDEGLSWPKKIVVDKNPAPDKKDYTAYSDIVKTAKRKIGVLYEKENYTQIVFKEINW